MMQTPFEYTVLAYLDGMLDRREEAKFLHEIARDPAKRALLEQHRKLNAALDHQNTSLPPLHTERALAQRIAVLEKVTPVKRTPPTATASRAPTFFTGLGRALSLFAGALVLSSFIALLLFTDILTVSDDDFPHRSVPIRQSTPTGKVDGSGNPVQTAQLGTAAETAIGSDKRNDDAVSTRPGSTPHTGSSRNETTIRTASMMTPNVAATDIRAISDDQVSGVSAGRTTAKLNDAAAYDRSGSGSDLLLHGIPPLPVKTSDGREISRLPAVSLRALLGGRLRAYVESGASQRQWLGSSGNTGDGFRDMYLIGVRWDFTPSVSAGLELGRSVFSREVRTTRTATVDGSPEVGIFVIENTFEDARRNWLRAHLLYTLNPTSLIRLQTNGGAGMSLASDRNLLFSIGMSALYPLGREVLARMGLHYSGAWLAASSASPLLPSDDSGPIGIVLISGPPGPVYTSSVDFRIGLEFQLW